MPISSKIIADSLSKTGVRITTLQITLPKVILAEFLTHRMFSRNFSSSRAIPTNKVVDLESFEPIYWGKNQAGMQAKVEEVDNVNYTSEIWQYIINQSKDASDKLAKSGLHKQWANRPNDWHVMATGVVTSTEWDNFFELRNHTDAQPEIDKLARAMKLCMDVSEPLLLTYGEWHLPYVTYEETQMYEPELLCMISSARTCRVSYLKQDGSVPSIEDDLKLFKRLAAARPMHLSPLEHQATPMQYSANKPDIGWQPGETHVDRYGRKWSGNFRGWVQHRQLWQNSY